VTTEPHQGTDVPLVSIVIPVRNGEQFIEEALASAFAQTYRRFEVIVVDDGSTDRTLDIVAGCGGPTTVIKQSNRGHAAARNQAMAVARGDWIAQLDADDRWEDTKLEQQIKRIHSADVIYTAARNFGDTSRVDDFTFRDRAFPEGDVFEELLAANFITHSSALIRAQMLRQVGGYDESLKSSPDWDLWLRLSAAGARFAGCREPLTHYRWTADAVSRNYRRTCESRLMVLERAMRSPRGQSLSIVAKRKARSNAWRTSAWFAGERDPRTALLWNARALAIWPFSAAGWRNLVRSALQLLRPH
jgi:glycosyltransferase involved in cell wall biosynthesis